MIDTFMLLALAAVSKWEVAHALQWQCVFMQQATERGQLLLTRLQQGLLLGSRSLLMTDTL